MNSSRDSHATYDQAYTEYQTRRSAWRRWIRRYYLRKAAGLTRGPALDFGCGVGELLKLLPSGSMGLEYNQATVDHCRRIGLDVSRYDGFVDDFSLEGIRWQGRANTLYLSHVLEHFEDPMHILRRLAESVSENMQRIVVIVPGLAGFRIDPTHRTHVDLPMIEATVREMPQWIISDRQYFPLNACRAGDFFPYNELQVVIDQRQMTSIVAKTPPKPLPRMETPS
jgi:SAM-dependent methyltransferase